MEYVIAFLVIVLSVVGIIGSILPALPGLPFNYAALLLLQYYHNPFSTTFIIVWAAITVAVMLLDYYFPIWTAKKFGATKAGITGSIIGMFAGMIIPPVGMIFGMIIGAVLGDMLSGKTTREALKSGMATFVGTMFSIGFKLLAAGFMTFYSIKELVKIYF